MIRKLFVVLSLVVFAATLGNVGNMQAVSQQIDLKKEEDVKRMIRRAMFGFGFEDLKLTYGAVRFEKDGNKIIVSDVSWMNKRDSAVFKELVVFDYEESSDTKDYSYDEAKVTGGAFSSKKVPDGPEVPKGKVSFYSFINVKGSDSKHTVSIEKMVMRGAGPQLPANSDKPELLIEATDIELVDINKVQASFREAITFKVLNGVDNPDKILAAFEILSKSLKAKKIQVTNLPDIPAKPGVSYVANKVTIDDFNIEKIGKISFEDIKLSIAGLNTEVGQIESISLKDLRLLDIIKFGKFAKENPGLKPTPELVSGVVKWLGGFSVKGIDIKTPDGDFSGDYSLNWGEYVGLFPTEIELDIKASLPVPPEKLIDPKSPTADLQKQVLDLVKEVGLEKLDVRMKIKIEWDENNQRIVISPFIYDVDKLYELSFSASIGNVSKAVLEEKDPKKLGVLFLGATVGPITLDIKDKGLQIFYDKFGKGSMEGVQSTVTIPELQPLFEDIIKLVNAPNGKIRIVVQPKSTVGLAQLAGAIAVSPMSIVTLFDIKSEYNKQ